MGVELATAYVSIIPETSKVAPAIRKEFGQVEKDAAKVGDRAGKSLGSRMSGMMGKALKGGALAIGAGAAAIAGTALVKGFGRLRSIDEAEAKLRGLGHSAKDIAGIMENVTAAVTGTAFGLDEAATASASALASGIKPGKELEKYLTLIGDAATQGGASFVEMASIINKTTATGKVGMENLNQLSERGIGIMSWLADEYGVTGAELSKMVSKGEVDLKTFRKVLTDNIGGAAQESGKTFSGSLANMQAALGRLGAKVLGGVFEQMPEIFGNVGTSLDDLGPKAERLGEILGEKLRDGMEWFKDTWPEIKQTGIVVKDALLPPLQTLGTLAVQLGGFLAKLPGPVKEFGAQAAIAALIIPRLTAAVTAAQLSLARYAVATGAATKRTALLGGTLRQVGGVGGAVFLTQGLTENKNTLGSWAKAVGGGAAAGAALGSVFPAVGTAIGAVGGAVVGTVGKLASLALSQDDAKESAARAAAKADTYAASIRAIASASGEAARAEAFRLLQTEGMIPVANRLGISTRTMVSATLGNAKAAEKVRNAWKSTGTVLDGIDNQKVTDWLNKQGFALNEVKRKQDEFNAAVKKQPKKSKTDVEANVKGQDKVKALIKSLEDTGKVKPKLGPFEASFRGQLGRVETGAEKSSRNIREFLLSGTTKARANLGPFRGDLLGQLGGIQGSARSGGSAIGSAISDGAAAGVQQRAWAIADAARNAVMNAVRAAKGAAQIKSPSRVTRRIGQQMGDGLALGISDRKARGGKAGKGLVRAITRSLRGALRDKGGDGLQGVLDRTRKQIDKALDSKDIGKKTAKNMTRTVNKVGKQLGRLGKQYDAHTAKLKDLQQARAGMVSGIASSISGELDLGSLGSEPNQFGFGGGKVTFANVASAVSGLAARARRFASRLSQLLKAGIPKGLVQEVAALGTTQGLKVADALLSGSKTQRSQLAKDYAGIGSAAQAAGNVLGGAFFDSGIAAQQGLIKGLLKDDGLNKAAKKLAKKLKKQIKKALGIKSPSTVMAREVGVPMAEGVGVGYLSGLDRERRHLNSATARLVSVPRLATAETHATARGAMTEADVLSMLDRIHLDVTVGADRRTKIRWYQEGKQGEVAQR